MQIQTIMNDSIQGAVAKNVEQLAADLAAENETLKNRVADLEAAEVPADIRVLQSQSELAAVDRDAALDLANAARVRIGQLETRLAEVEAALQKSKLENGSYVAV